MGRRLERFAICLDAVGCVDRFFVPADEDYDLIGVIARNGSGSGGAVAAATLTSGGVFTGWIAATNVLNAADTPHNGDSFTLGTKPYTFRTALTPVEGEILIGGSAAVALDNALSAVNHTGTPGTDYSCAVAHPTVQATTNTATDQTFQARTGGVGGNAIASTIAGGGSGHITFTGGALFTGGLDAETVTLGTGATAKTYAYVAVLSIPAVANEVLIGANQTASHLNILRAVNKAAGEGTLYGTGTVAHSRILGLSSDGTTTVFNARVKGTAGNAFASTETCANASFVGVTFASGTDMTLMLRSCANGVAVASGTAMLAAEMDLAGTPINSSVVGLPNRTIFNTQLRKGYAIGLDFTGTVTNTVGLVIGVILRRTGPAIYA